MEISKFQSNSMQALLAGVLVAKAKQVVHYDNPKWYCNIVFGESSLKK
jgi:hypothetical protein